MEHRDQILSRIRLIDEYGNDLVFAYNRDAFKHFNIPIDYDGQFLQIGSCLIFNQVAYEITKVVFKLFTQTYKPIEGGVSETPELTEMSGYNSEVNVYLKRTSQ
ncbi:hypothetical protein [Sphingobacterium cellulitidis]|uniref:Uncharacterized protein n=1 Tax=Sphingobacterium cellulitidis TaxID=1768011 RepID=A0A8H9KVB5_9SPHI|nr:hypothetical protein [Sphingobacterium soli]MBA8986212.1 hypothetical protein [Sphingobacterium soli]GGE18495.1 hypothetical protein GCM10011516_15180 [Sphingobacterium soli]